VKYVNSYELLSNFTTTRAPTFNGEGEFAECERDIRLWSAMTDIAEVKKGAAVLGGLSGPAKDFCATLSLKNILLLESGVEAVLNHLRIGFAASNEMQLQSDVASFLDYSELVRWQFLRLLWGISPA
jgi:hypothetical protein